MSPYFGQSTGGNLIPPASRGTASHGIVETSIALKPGARTAPRWVRPLSQKSTPRRVNTERAGHGPPRCAQSGAMPSCVQLGATDFGSTSDLADPEGMPNSTVQELYLPRLTTGVRGGCYASSKLRYTMGSSGTRDCARRRCNRRRSKEATQH